MSDEGFGVSATFWAAQSGAQPFVQQPRWRSDEDVPDESFCIEESDVVAWRRYLAKREMRARWTILRRRLTMLSWVVFHSYRVRVINNFLRWLTP